MNEDLHALSDECSHPGSTEPPLPGKHEEGIRHDFALRPWMGTCPEVSRRPRPAMSGCKKKNSRYGRNGLCTKDLHQTCG